MIELFIGDQPLRLKSNIDIKVGTVERFNIDDNIDLDIVSLARILYPKYVLSTGSGATVSDRRVAFENGLYFSRDFDIEALINVIKKDPQALERGNRKLTEVEKDYARIIKKRKPIPVNQKSLQAYVNNLTAKRTALISKWQPDFQNDISQKTDLIRQEISDRYGIDASRISKESVAVSSMEKSSKSELFEIMDIYNIQQEITNLQKLHEEPFYSFSFIPFGSVSGRSSTFGENIHGMTKGQFGIFSKKVSGRRLVSIDFSQIELRLAAALWGDFAMQDVFNKDGDIHLNTAKMIGSDLRQLAKALNFGLLYGMGIETFMAYCAKDFGIILTFEEAKLYVETFKKTYPALFDKKTTEFQGLSYKTKTLGREMHAQEVWGGMYDMKKHTIMRNIQIQGEGQDILKPTVIELDKMLNGIGEIAFEMYDEVGFWIDDNSSMETRLNSICDDLTAYVKDFSGFSIPVQISDRF